MAIQRHPVKSKFCKLRLLCRSLAGNNVYYLTVTAPSAPEDENQKVHNVLISFVICGLIRCFPSIKIPIEKEGDCD